MKSLFALILVLMCAGAADAGMMAQTKASKPSRGWAPPPTSLSVTRQGGDTYATALAIPSIPFSATGSTVGYANDYDVGCGQDNDLSPDVVYLLMPPMTGYYVLDLCGSQYDVKLAVCDYNGNVVACNDDDDYFADPGDPCLLDSRLEDIYLDVHNPYYIVIDGYDGDAGDYTLAIGNWTHSEVVVPGGCLAEGEPTMSIGQEDIYNCGCDCSGAPANLVVEGDTSGEAIVALVMGWRGWGESDADWLQLTAGASGDVQVELESAVDAQFWVVTPTDCLAEQTIVVGSVAGVGTGIINTTVPAGQDFLIRIKPVQPVPPHGAVPYAIDGVLHVSGLSSPQPLEWTSWGELKSLYR